MMIQRPKVLIAGATGYIGGGVLEVLHQQGFWIRALCRDPSRLRHPDWCNDIFIGHATQPETLNGLCDDIDVVFSSLGIRSFQRHPNLWEVDYQANLNILEAAQTAGVQHFIFVSVLHAAEMARLSPIAQARAKVAHAVIHSGMNYNIFEPTGFFNDARSFLVMAQKRGRLHLPGDGSGVINPLSALDFGEEVARVITDPSQRNRVKSVGGPEQLSHRQLAEVAFQLLNKEPRLTPLPAWGIAVVALLLRPFNYNAYALMKFLEFIARTPNMTGEPVGHRSVTAFFRNLAQGMSLIEAESALASTTGLV